MMTFTVFHAAQNCRVPGSTVLIAVMSTRAENQGRWPAWFSQPNYSIRLASQAALVLSFDAMKYRYCLKLVTYLLVTTFLVASAGTVFGYAWCFGNDGLVEVSYSKVGGCCAEDVEQSATDRYAVPSLSQSSADSCGSCLDVSTQQRGAVFFKRLKQVSTASVASLAADSFSPKMVQGDLRVARLTSLSPRVSPTILAHRTVVLLN